MSIPDKLFVLAALSLLVALGFLVWAFPEPIPAWSARVSGALSGLGLVLIVAAVVLS